MLIDWSEDKVAGGHRTEFKDAIRYIKELTSTSKVNKLHEKYFHGVCSLSAFRRYLKEPNTLVSANPPVQDAILAFYRQRSEKLSPRSNLFRILAAALRIDGQTGTKNYEGEYTSYRRSAQSGKIVTGQIRVFRDPDFGFTFFEHRSQQPIIDNTLQPFDHEGPVYVLSTRIYMIGIGTDSTGSYLRPMILRAVDDPRKQELEGILLTETTNHKVPFASRTVLLHNDKRAELERTYKLEFEERLLAMLEPSYFFEGILRGWSSDLTPW